MTEATTMTTEGTNKAAQTKEGKERQAKKKAKPRALLPQNKIDKSIKIVVGLDLGDKQSLVCEVDDEGEVTDVRLATTEAELRRHFEGKPRRRIIMEVGAQSRWVDALLSGLGHEVLVLDPRRLKAVTATLYKDDRVDAAALACLGRESAGLLKTIKHRDLAQQQILTLVRARACLVAGRTRLVNTIRGLLKPYGIRLHKDSHSIEFINSFYDRVPPPIRVLIEPMFPALEEIRVRIHDFDKQVDALFPTFAPSARNLTSIYGVANLTALYFVALVGDPKRFSNVRDVGAYFGLCRRRNDSGERKSELGITKAGDRYMRALLANAASNVLGPYGKDSDLRTWGLKKRGAGSKIEKRKAKVAVARKLAVIMLTLWKSGKEYKPFRETQTQAQA